MCNIIVNTFSVNIDKHKTYAKSIDNDVTHRKIFTIIKVFCNFCFLKYGEFITFIFWKRSTFLVSSCIVSSKEKMYSLSTTTQWHISFGRKTVWGNFYPASLFSSISIIWKIILACLPLLLLLSLTYFKFEFDTNWYKLIKYNRNWLPYWNYSYWWRRCLLIYQPE